MKRDVLAALNARRAARQPVALVTHLASGEGWVVDEKAQPLTAPVDTGAPLPKGERRVGVPEALQNVADFLSPLGRGDRAFDKNARSCGTGYGEGNLDQAIQAAFRIGKSGLVQVEGEDYFITIHLPPARLIIIGAVHISQHLAQMARMVSLDCTIIDPRTAFATPERFAGVTLLAQWPQDVLPDLKPDAFTAFAALTHDPKIDDPALDAALKAKCFYIGALGSRKTHAARLTRLQALGHQEADLAAIHAPIGLDIGAISPAEIAVSILAEIIAAMRMKRRV